MATKTLWRACPPARYAPRRGLLASQNFLRNGFSTSLRRNEASSTVGSASDPPHKRSGPLGAATVDSKAGAQGTDLMTGERTVAPGSEDIDVSRLTIEKTNAPKPQPRPEELIFGRKFTDHMLVIPWSSSSGWSAPKIQPYQPLALDPSATIFHYAPSLFEGMKAYKGEDGKVRLFRPDKNMERMIRSAARLAFPTFTGEHLTELLKKLIALDKDWIPTEPGYSLYVRPTMIGTQAGLGVGASSDALLFVILSPCGPYYPTGFKPVSLLASTKDVRAWPGGTGNYKIAANYAPGVQVQLEAAAQGYQQILWLFGEDHELTEVGTMNLFVVLEKEDGTTELVTPPLKDIILPGVTRDSVLSIARLHESGKAKIEGLPDKLQVSERKICMPEIVEAAEKGRLKEIFGSGTAVIISTVESIGYEGKRISIPVGKKGIGPIAEAAYREIVGRQTGAIESDWSVIIE